MAPRVSFAKTTVSYPVYSADFDTYNRGYLVVGGGGGESRSGVANKITLLEVSNPEQLTIAAEITLSRDEDSVTCLANLASRDGLITYAGVNSGTSDIKAGKNEHFRAFKIEYPRKAETGSSDATLEKAADGRIYLLGKSSLFSPAQGVRKETYQRVIRLSPVRRNETASKRLGIIATGLAQESEVLLFNATVATPVGGDVIQRVVPPNKAEAADVDLVELVEEEFKWVYCTDYDVYLAKVSFDFAQKKPRGKLNEPAKIYSSHTTAGSIRPRLRALRFLMSNHLLVLANLPGMEGVELLLLRIYDDGPAQLILRKKLASHVRASTGMDVCLLDADPVTGARQIVIAVAGQDRSVSIFTLDYQGTKSDSLGQFRLFSVTKEVHSFQITKTLLSPFHPPSETKVNPPSGPSSSKMKRKAEQQKQGPPGPQKILLATTSMGNTVVVDTITLEPFKSSKSTRYILSSARATALRTGFTTLVSSILMIFFLLALQSAVAVNFPNSSIGQFRLHDYVPESLMHTLSGFAPPGSRRLTAIHDIESIISHPLDGGRRIKDLLEHLSSSRGAAIIRASDDGADAGNANAGGLATELHPDQASVLRQDADAKKWEELSPEEQEKWKRALVHAGAWAVDEGDTVLKGIFFSSVAGAVGAVVAGMLR